MPYDFFVGCHLEYLGLLTDVAVSTPVTYNRVAVWKSLDAGYKPKRVTFEVIFIKLPDNLIIRIDLNKFMSITAGYDCISVGQPDSAVTVALDREGTNNITARVIFPHDPVHIVAYEVIAIHPAAE